MDTTTTDQHRVRMRGTSERARFGELGCPATEISCVVADDHPAILQAVSDYLNRRGYLVAASARDGKEALAEIEEHRPSVAVVDLRLPDMSGIEVARRVTRSVPASAVLIYSAYAEAMQAVAALDAGARGFALKEAPLSDLANAVDMVAAGLEYIDPVLAPALAQVVSSELTSRERDVLRALADGLTNEASGERLGISAESIRTHVRKATEKLGAETRTQAVATALRQSIIT